MTLAGSVQSPSLTANEVNQEHWLLARLGAGGPVLDSLKLNAFWVQAAADSYMWVIERQPDYEIWEDRMVTKNVPDGVQIRIDIFKSGVMFADDGLTQRWLTNADLDELGEYWFRMICPEYRDSACHNVFVYDNGVKIGTATYSSYGLPEEQ